jgi:phage-related protein
MATYDGSLTVDTKVDPKGFNEGTAKLKDGTKDISGGLDKVLTSVKAIGAVIAGGLGIGAVVSLVQGMVGQFSIMSSSFGQELMSIRWAFIGLVGDILEIFIPAFEALYPYILQAVQWLTQLAVTLAEVSRAFFGVAVAQKAAALAQGELNKAMGQGALAGFDKLNVLNGKPQLPTITVPPEIQKAVDDFKKKIMDLWNTLGTTWQNISKWVTDTWNLIVQDWGKFSDWFKKNVTDPVVNWFSTAWTNIQSVWTTVSDWFDKNVITPLSSRFTWLVGILSDCWKQIYASFIKPLSDAFMAYLTFMQTTWWPPIQKIFGLIGSLMMDYLGLAVSVFVTNFKTGFDTVVSIFGNIFAMIAGVVGDIVTIIGGIIEFVTGVFTHNWGQAWQGIHDIFKGIFMGIYDVVKGVVNIVIDLINGMVQAIANGVNAIAAQLNSIQLVIPSWVPGFGGDTFGINLPYVNAPQIPHLASGAVIPPNSAFAAILGDQTNSRNIEAPEGLIRQIVSEELGKSLTGQNISISFEGSMAQFVQALNPHITHEQNRIGKSLVKNTAYNPV